MSREPLDPSSSDRPSDAETVEHLRRRIEALQRRVDDYEALLEILPVGVWWGDARCERITGNRAAYEMLGLPHGINASVSAEHDRLTMAKCMIDGREAEPHELPMQRAAFTGEVVTNVEHDVVLGDGTSRTVYCNVVPILGADGRVRSVVGVYADITEKKRLERELRESEERFRQFMRNCPASAYIKDAEGRYLWVNTLLEHAYDRPLREWTGRTDDDLFPSEEVARVRENDRAVLDGKAPTSFVETVTFAGQRRHYLSYKFPIQDARGGPLLAGMSIDVTEQVRVRHRLETMFSASLIGSVTWRLDGAITSANDAFLASVGYTRQELEAGGVSWRALTPPEYEGSDRAKLVELATQRSHPPYEKEYVHKDGTRVPVLVSAALFPDSDDEGISYVVDLSEVKRAEQRIRELLAQVSATSRAKDDFLATLAHELRNPLAPIRNAVQILKAKGAPDPTLVWGREVIDRQVGHMARLLEDLLDVSRISRDKLELRRQPVELASIIDAAVETSRPLIDAGGHHLSLEVPPGSLCVDGDPVRLAQVFANLLNNAAKYTPDRGTITLTATREGGEVVVCVGDDGIGIAADMLPRVFELFSQAEPALGRAQGGLGIGLSLVKGIVELHGGTITARSAGPSLGSQFTVRLPIVATAAAERHAHERPPTPAPRHRVLVVDDNVDSADSLATLLEIMGHEVTIAYDGSEAIAIAQRIQPTVVLLDLGMPGTNGFDVCRRLRAAPWARSTAVIAMTGWGHADDRRRTRDAGFDHHLVKPVDIDALAELLADRAPPAHASASRVG